MEALPRPKDAIREAKNYMHHKGSCPPPASNFQKGRPCKCGKDAAVAGLDAVSKELDAAYRAVQWYAQQNGDARDPAVIVALLERDTLHDA